MGSVPARSLPFSHGKSPGKGQIALAFAVGLILLVSAALRLFALDRIPPGWHHDEALMGVMAGEVYRGEEYPIFFRQFLGQEPLYIYASAAVMALLGGDPDVLPLRLASVVSGLLTVALTFPLARSLFGTRVGLLAMALVGESFWQVMSSRNGYRSITQPLLEAMAIYLLWRALATGKIRWYAASGLALGGTLYTYLGARAFPGVFVVFALWLLVTRRKLTGAALTRGAILGFAALLVAAPLLEFFLTNPGTWSARMEQVFIFRSAVNGGHPWRMFADNFLKMIGGFTFSGEPMWRYNIPGRPMFVGLLAVAFYIGLVALLARLRRGDDAAALSLIWLAVMFFPSLLSWDIGAYTLRAMGLVPMIYLVPALGLAWIWDRLSAWPGVGKHIATVAVLGVLVVEGIWTARDYFVVWAPSFGASWEGHADAVAQARFLMKEAEPAREEIFVGNEYYHHPTIAQLARPVYPSLRWFDGRQSTVFSPDATRPALYVLGLSGMPRDVTQLFKRGTKVGESDFTQGVDGGAPPPLFLAYRLTPEQIRATVADLTGDPTIHPVAGRIAGVLEPLGARLDRKIKPEGNLSVTLIWRVVGPPPEGDYQLTAQLIDHDWKNVSDQEWLGYPPTEWRSGDVVLSHFDLAVPGGTSVGLYRVQVAFYDRHSGARLPVEGGQPGIQGLLLGDVRVVSAEPPPEPSHAIGARLGSDIVLIGADAPRLENRDGLVIDLQWKAERALSEDYTVFVQLLDGNGRLVAQSDSFPAGGALPTSSWFSDEVIRDEHRLTLPSSLPPGRYRLIAGMYLLSTGERLPTSTGDSVELDPVTIP